MLGKPTVLTRNGGSIPVVGDFATHLGVPTILMGFGLPDDGLHSPNEKYRLGNYYTGIMTIAHFFEQFGEQTLRHEVRRHLATKIDNPAPSESVVRSAGMVSVAVAMSRVTGLLREIVMARLFGAGFVYDAFLLGFRIPNLTRDLFAEGALSSAFVPIFTQTLEHKGRKEAALLSNLVATALIIVVGLFCLLGIVFAPVWVNLLASGFHQVPGKFELAVKLTRIMFPFLLLVALAAQAMGVLNACNRFAVPALASTFFNIGSVAFGLILGYVLAPHLGIEPDHRHGHRRGAGRRSAAGLAIAGVARRRIPFPSGHRLAPSRCCARSSA